MTTVKKDCGFFNPHEWTRWKTYAAEIQIIKFDDSLGEKYTQPKQIRVCVKCGLEQRRDV